MGVAQKVSLKMNQQQLRLTGLQHLYTGKVRDTFDAGPGQLLMVTSDRISAFDHNVGEIPKKGELLNSMSLAWFARLAHIVPNHLLPGVAPEDVVAADEAHLVVGRGVVVKKLQPIQFEAVVRGYLAGSGWNDYRETGAVCGIALPACMRNAEKLATPIFTPATKAPVGGHDVNVSFDQMADDLGRELTSYIREVSIRLYETAAAFALTKGIIIADTKFEFGLDEDGVLTLMDEVLTPDSSRFWPVEDYQAAFEAGRNPPSYDKQFVRDWLQSQGWSGQNESPPALPTEIIQKTASKYGQAYRALCWS